MKCVGYEDIVATNNVHGVGDLRLRCRKVETSSHYLWLSFDVLMYCLWVTT